MKKHLLLLSTLVIFCIGTACAQVSSTPEVPRNYKPKPKELLPMPDSLTDEKIFPVLGEYTVSRGDSTYTVSVTRDDTNKGAVWISGFPQGKFTAVLRDYPAVYKIPAQKAQPYDEIDESSAKKTSPIAEGTLIFDETDSTLYVNIGNKYNEDNPAAVFEALHTEATTDDSAASASISPKKNKKPVVKSIFYTGKKSEPVVEP
ncbi:MAG: hypothetical protein QM727_13960 [Niabella sp.]